jgi:hypothetical protein
MLLNSITKIRSHHVKLSLALVLVLSFLYYLAPIAPASVPACGNNEGDEPT